MLYGGLFELLNMLRLPLRKDLTKCGLIRHCRQLSIDNLNGPYNYVDGRRVVPADNCGEIHVIDPSNHNLICTVPSSGELEIHNTVQIAKKAFLEWKQWSSVERGRILVLAGSKIRQNLKHIAKIETKNNGKPIWESMVDIASCAEALEYFGGVIPSLTGQHIPLKNHSFAMICREPLGVVAGIGAWNFPMQTCTWKVAPALACGNTMIYKPSPFTPLTALILAEIFSDVGLPNGVLNIIQGEGKTGSLLCQHADIAKISFTGSVPTGILVSKIAASQLKKVTLELGGKSPLIIFEDCDIMNAVKATLMANFLSQGEVCSNGTRVFVHEKILSEFTERLLEATKKLKIGNPFDEDTAVGATISKDHAERVLNYIVGAEKEGAEIMYGGKRMILPPPLENGFYLSPCILTNCRDDMTVVREEVFGAVLSILSFSNEEEAIQRANNSQFGLAGAVFTRDLTRAMRVAQQLECGMVWTNTYNLYPPQLPFGGYKLSGVGRENGTAVLEHYTQTKTVYIEMGEVDCGQLHTE